MGREPDLSERLTLKDGAIEQTNFHDYKTIRLADVPEIDVELIGSGHHPRGVGGLSLCETVSRREFLALTETGSTLD